jgi:MFS superfamily sulfate permease-like transporter
VAGAGVLGFGVLFGMLLAVALSLLLALRRFAQPLVSELGLLPGTRDYLDCERHPETRVHAGILVMRPEEPMFFANAEQVFSLVRQRTGQRQARVVVLSLEMSDDFDTTVMESLAEFTTALSQNGVTLLLARVKDKPREALLRQGLADGRLGHPTLYWSVDDAMKAAQRLNARSAGPGALAT